MCSTLRILMKVGFDFPNEQFILVHMSFLKANNAEKVFFSANRFLPWEILLVKKMEIEKTKTTFVVSVFKFVY